MHLRTPLSSILNRIEAFAETAQHFKSNADSSDVLCFSSSCKADSELAVHHDDALSTCGQYSMEVNTQGRRYCSLRQVSEVALAKYDMAYKRLESPRERAKQKQDSSATIAFSVVK
jgi:hypothetical protein